MTLSINHLMPESLELNEQENEIKYYWSPKHNLSPLSSKYKSRLMKPKSKKRKSMKLRASTTSDTEEVFEFNNNNDNNNNQLNIVSSKSMPETEKTSFPFHSNICCDSDRFIPRRFDGFTNNDSFNLMDKFNHSPLSIMKSGRNDNNINNEYHSDSSSNCSNHKYDQCLQDILLTNNQKKQKSNISSKNHIIPNIDETINDILQTKYCKQYKHHLSECPLNSDKNKLKSNQKCLCKYIIKKRLNYTDSPQKVLSFKHETSNNHNNNNDDKTSICCLSNNVQNILESKKTKINRNGDNEINEINAKPIKTINLLKYHKRKKLANDYYYHLMDFKPNKNFGCIVIKDCIHLIKGHFGKLEKAENNKYLYDLNKSENINKYDFHFCSVKLSPNNNYKNSNIMCLGDNMGRLLFYDYNRKQYVFEIYKSNQCRISVIDWKNFYNSMSGLIAVGSLDKLIRIYDDRIYKQCFKLKYHLGEVCGLKWNKYNDHLLISGGNQNIVCCWDIRKNNKPLFVGNHKAAIRALEWYPNSDNMFISGGGSNDQCIKIWNTHNHKKKEILSLLTGSQVTNILSLQYNKSNYIISSHGFSSNSIIVWNISHHINHNKNKSEISLQRIKQLNGHKCRVLYLCKYSDSNIVSSSAGPDQTIKYWKIFPTQQQSQFVYHTSNIIR